MNRLNKFGRFIFIVIILIFSLEARSSVRYLQEGDESLLKGQYKKAAAYYLKALNYAAPKQKPLLWDDLGLAYLRMGKWDEAESYLRLAASHDTANYDVRLYLSAVFLLRGEEREAFKKLETIQRNIYFDNSWTWEAGEMIFYHPDGSRLREEDWMELSRERGVFLERKDNPGNKLQVTVHIDALHESNEALFHFLRAAIFSGQGRRSDFEREFRAAQASGYPLESASLLRENLEPELLSLHHRFRDHRTGLLREKLIQFQKILERGNISAAVSALHQALDLDPASFHANHNLALIYLDQALMSESGIYGLEKAKKYCARALWYQNQQTVKKRDIISCLDLMGNIHFQQNNFTAAQNEYRKILNMEPAHRTARYNLACSYFNLGKIENAENIWLQILRDSKREKESEEIKNPEDRIHSVTVRRAPIEYLTYKALGNLYLSQKKFSLAAEKLKKAVAIRPQSADPYFNLAVALAEEKKWDEAADHMQKYIYLGGPQERQARENLKKWRDK